MNPQNSSLWKGFVTLSWKLWNSLWNPRVCSRSSEAAGPSWTRRFPKSFHNIPNIPELHHHCVHPDPESSQSCHRKTLSQVNSHSITTIPWDLGRSGLRHRHSQDDPDGAEAALGDGADGGSVQVRLHGSAAVHRGRAEKAGRGAGEPWIPWKKPLPPSPWNSFQDR